MAKTAPLKVNDETEVTIVVTMRPDEVSPFVVWFSDVYSDGSFMASKVRISTPSLEWSFTQ